MIDYEIDVTNLGEVLACAAIAWLSEGGNPECETGFRYHNGGWLFSCPDPSEQIEQIRAQILTANDDHLTLGNIRLDWWNPGWGLNHGMKLWAGRLTAKSVLTNLLTASQGGAPSHWLDYHAPTGGRLGVDPQGSWDSLSLGWSINEHDHFKMTCRPFVEWLAFIGLQLFPVQGERRNGFRYSLWQPVPLELARLAFTGQSGHSLTQFHVPTAKSGQITYLKPAAPMTVEVTS